MVLTLHHFKLKENCIATEFNMKKHPEKLIYWAFIWATVSENVAVIISGPVQPKVKIYWWASLSDGVSQHRVMFAEWWAVLGPTLWINSVLGEREVLLLGWKNQPIFIRQKAWADKQGWLILSLNGAGLNYFKPTTCTRPLVAHQGSSAQVALSTSFTPSPLPRCPKPVRFVFRHKEWRN